MQGVISKQESRAPDEVELRTTLVESFTFPAEVGSELGLLPAQTAAADECAKNKQ
jgi:hypothetical protein